MTGPKQDRKAPMVGQFSGPRKNAPRMKPLQRKEDSKDSESPEKKDSSEQIEEIDLNAEQTLEDVHDEYLEGLKKVGLTISRARALMDEMLEHDYCTETHQWRKNKKVVIRTRSYKDTLRTQRYLEVESPTYAANVDEIIMRYNTAASLVRYGDHTFKHPEDNPEASDEEIEDAFQIRLRFVERLPNVVMGKLGTLVHNMDVRMAAVFAEGAPEDF